MTGRVDFERGTSDGGDERAGRRVVGNSQAGDGEVVAAVARGEQDADASAVSDQVGVVEGGLGGVVFEQVTESGAPRVGDDRGAAADGRVHGIEQAGVQAVHRTV